MFVSLCVAQGCALQRLAVPDLRALVVRGMTQYEREEKALNILLFPEILDHLVRIDRVLSVESGAMLLVGRSGNVPARPHVTTQKVRHAHTRHA